MTQITAAMTQITDTGNQVWPAIALGGVGARRSVRVVPNNDHPKPKLFLPLFSRVFKNATLVLGMEKSLLFRLVRLDGVHPWLAFIGGVVVGCSFSLYLVRSQRLVIPFQHLTLTEAIKLLKSHNSLKPNLSAAENARAALTVLNQDCRLTKSLKAPIVYALAVLKSEFVVMSIPIGLWDAFNPFDASASTRYMSSSFPRSAVQDWILSNFSAIRTSARNSRCTFRGVALGVRFAVRLQTITSKNSFAYIFDTTDEEMGDIIASLDRVNEWDWSVWELKRASTNRPLQVLFIPHSHHIPPFPRTFLPPFVRPFAIDGFRGHQQPHPAQPVSNESMSSLDPHASYPSSGRAVPDSSRSPRRVPGTRRALDAA